MITMVEGNLLADDAEALVNTVNTVGVMGKGIALQFRRAYPQMFKEYEAAAKSGGIRIGAMNVWETGLLAGPRYIINFPTKKHWRSPSDLEYVRAGLTDLVDTVLHLGIRSIAVPPLGAGNGGLHWPDVAPLIYRAFEAAPEVDVRLYAPSGPPRAADMRNAETAPQMTPGRAALVVLLAEYARAALDTSLIEAQKLMYFLQESGEPLRLSFVGHRYGPYSDALRHVLSRVEGHFLIGFGDASAPVLSAEPLRVVPSAIPLAQRALESSGATTLRIARVLELVDGFESMYGVELLATVHWCARDLPLEFDSAASAPRTLLDAVHGWSPRKRRMFSREHVDIAWRVLLTKGWLPAGGAVGAEVAGP